MYGIYIHIPFCVRKCPYCDFYSVAVKDDIRTRFLKALKNEILSFEPVEADTVYFGGGTPSLLKPSEMSDILDLLHQHDQISGDAEISMECNPASVTKENLKEFRKAGINRLSLGCQSFEQELLDHLGRLHTAEEAKQTVRDAMDAGFDNVSVDIMLGIPFATAETTRRDAVTAASLGVQHISAYLLKIAEGTPFAKGVDGIPSDDVQADCYRTFCEEMDRAGYHQYEISNFAKSRFESRHNLKYWECGQWLGLGPSAHMSDGKRRYSFPSDLKTFFAAFENGSIHDPLSAFRPEGIVDAEEYIIMGLRKDNGISRDVLARRFEHLFTPDQEKFMEECEKHGLMKLSGDTIRLTRDGFLLSNSILSELID